MFERNTMTKLIAAAALAVAFPAFAQDAKPTTPDAPKQVQTIEVKDKEKEKETAKPAKKETTLLSIGDAAPELKIEKFIKGEPVTGFEKGKVYIVEFWATWCGPCRAAFPHLSENQAKYKDKGVTFIGVNVWENYDEMDFEGVSKFVKEQGDKMAYTVAYDGPKANMANSYMKAAGQNGIPASFIVNQDGKIAWIGHPMNMDEPLAQIVAGKYDMAAEVAKAKSAKEAAAKMKPLQDKLRKAMSAEEWDNAIAAIDEITALDKNKYGNMLMLKFNVLLDKKDEPAKAYAMKDALLAHPEIAKNAQMLNQIAWGIVDPEGDVPKKKRDLDFATAVAAKAVEASKNEDGTIIDTLARCYWEKGEKQKAVDMQTDAVKKMEAQMKKLKDEGKGDQAEGMDEMLSQLKGTLDQYKKEIAKTTG